MKKISILVVVLAVMMLFAACSSQSAETTPEATVLETQGNEAAENTTPENNAIVAMVNNEPVYQQDYNEAYAYYVNYYSYLYGEDLSGYESEISEAAMSGAVSEKIYLTNLEKLGYLDYTEDQIAEADIKAQEDIDSYIDESYGEEIATALGEGYTVEEYREAAAAYEDEVLDNVFERTRQEVVDYYLLDAAKDRAYEEIAASVVPTEQEVQDSYDKLLADYIEEVIDNPSLCVTDIMDGNKAYYVPAGVRMVRQILIKMDEELANAINILIGSELNDAADILRQEALARIEDEANEVLSKIKKGEITFSEAIEEYNEDTSMPEDGYPVAAGIDTYVESFTLGAMALENIADVSDELIASNFGYHILEYYSDVEEGELALEDVYDDLYEDLAKSKSEQVWNDMVAKWQEEAVIEYF